MFCYSLQASPVLPLCPPWGIGKVGEERGDPGGLEGSNLKRLPYGALHYDPQAWGLSVPAFQARALPLEPLAPRHRLLRQIPPTPYPT